MTEGTFDVVRGTLSRRSFLAGLASSWLGCASRSRISTDPAVALAALASRLGGRLGVHVLDTSSGVVLSHRGRERFAMCSTFKWVLAANVLSDADRGTLRLEDEIPFTAAELLEYAPIVRRNLARGRMTIGELAEAAVTVSDNTAANLLLQRVGGPTGLTQFLRNHGDAVTHLDRNEPTLNTNAKGDERDTTTPEAMVSDLRTLLLGTALTAESRGRLVDWMIASTTGTTRLRAGAPKDWRVGDKTGTGANGAFNDVAIAWPPNRAPILIAAYMSESSSTPATLNGAHAEIGRIVAARFG